MKQLKPYILLLLFIGSLLGCEPTSMPEKEDVVLIPEHGYIFFNPNISSTRGDIIVGKELKRDFGVIAYKWEYNTVDDLWGTKEDGAKPNVFADTPLRVTYDDDSKLYSYTDNGGGLIDWTGGHRYAFFAYHPYSMPDGASGSLTLSDEDTEGTPFLIYTMPDNADDMIDIVTAKKINTEYTENNGEVALQFDHRLAAIEVEMLNLNDPIDIYTDAELEELKEVYVKLTNFTITLKNQRYEKIKLYMDESIGSELTEFAEKKDRKYTLFAEKTLPPPTSTTDSEGNIKYTYEFVESGNPLIFIPQKKDDESTEYNEYLFGEIDFDVEYVDSEGTPIDIDNDNNSDNDLKFEVETPLDLNINHDILEKRKCTVQLTFSRNAVSIEIKEPGDWDEYSSIIDFY